jgi:hypothetical protein
MKAVETRAGLFEVEDIRKGMTWTSINLPIAAWLIDLSFAPHVIASTMSCKAFHSMHLLPLILTFKRSREVDEARFRE